LRPGFFQTLVDPEVHQGVGGEWQDHIPALGRNVWTWNGEGQRVFLCQHKLGPMLLNLSLCILQMGSSSWVEDNTYKIFTCYNFTYNLSLLINDLLVTVDKKHTYIIKWAPLFKLSLLLKNYLQDIQTLQLN
jgi:hypothetical protein